MVYAVIDTNIYNQEPFFTNKKGHYQYAQW